MKPACAFAVFLVTAGWLLPALAGVTASLDRDQIGSGDTVTLTLRHDGRSGDQPDLSPLDKDFDILGRSSGSSYQIVNGHMSSQTQLQLTLSPKHSGQLGIPAIRWGAEQSEPLQLSVSAAGAAPSNSGGTSGSSGTASAHVFLSSSLHSAEPYVQAADILTVRLYTDQPLQQGSLDLPTSNDIVVKPLGKDRQSSEVRDGREYRVIERKYLLVPQRSGALQLDGPVLDAQIVDTGRNPLGNDPLFKDMFGRDPFAGMMGVARPIRVHGDPIRLQVRARPAAASGQDWVPAQSLTLEESVKPESGAIHVGEPITLHLHLSGQGVPAATLPDLSARLNLPDGLKAYPDQATLDTQVQGDTVIGTRDQDVAVIADRAGHFTIPPLTVAWWDTAKNVARTAEIPARSLDILPAPGAAAQPVAPVVAAPRAAPTRAAPGGGEAARLDAPAPLAAVAESRALPWKWISVALALFWLATLFAWWRSLGRRPPVVVPASTEEALRPTSAAEALKAFQQACRNDDAAAARQHLLAWARAYWPGNPPTGLGALAKRLGDAQLDALLPQLDRACYAGGEWRGAALAQVFKAPAAKPAAKAAELADLYP